MDQVEAPAITEMLERLSLASLPATYSIEEVAKMLSCSVESVEIQSRRGRLPGLKFGRQWIFPAFALHKRLNEIALIEAAKRTGRLAHPVTVVQPTTRNKPRRTGKRIRPIPTILNDEQIKAAQQVYNVFR